MAYDFHYTPTGTGVISGKEVLEQTEDAINDLGNTAISGVQEALDKAEQALTNSENAVDDAQTALNTANNAEGVAIQAQTDVGNLSGTVTNIGNRVTTAEGNITNLQGRMTTAEGNITNLQGRMTTAETNIGNLQTAVSTAQATANSAQQTATTARQQSYVFRYSGTAVVPNSTIAYSTIDNTDNIKSGDKILDVDGKLFEITAVDTANQTVTVGSALIDVALDANVVHTSGNETVGGQKTFSDNLSIYNSDNSVDTPVLNIKTSKYVKGDTTNTDTMRINFLDSNGNNVASVYANKNTSGSQYLAFQVYTTDNNNANITSIIHYYITKNGDKYLTPYEDNQISLGGSVRRWKSVYATNYYYGSNNVEFSTKFVTTDTSQTISGEKTFSSSLRISNSDTTVTTPDLNLKNYKADRGTTDSAVQAIQFLDKNGKALTTIESRRYSNGNTATNILSYNTDTNNNTVSGGIAIIKSQTETNFAPNANNAVTCGRPLAKWSDVQTYQINGLTPSSLSMPVIDRTKYVDISGYFTNTGSGDINTYSVTANGWVYLRLTDIDGCQLSVLDSSNNRLYGSTSSGNLEQLCLPVTAGTVVETQWTTSTSVTVAIARFIPCQGNI